MAEANNIALDTLLGDRDTVATYKAQYTGLSEFQLPDTGALDDMDKDKTLRHPFAYPVPKGAPSKTRKDNAAKRTNKRLKKMNKDKEGQQPLPAHATRGKRKRK